MQVFRDLRSESVTPAFQFWISYSKEDSCRWAVWLGQYALDREIRAPKAALRWVRNL